MRIAACLLMVVCACAPVTPRSPPPLSAVAATPAAPFLPEARPLFDDCSPLPNGGAERAYRCGDATAWVAESSEWSPAEALRAGWARVRARLGPGVREARVELPLAGLPADTVRFSACEGETCRGGGFLAALTAAAGRTRLVGCVARGEDSRPKRARCLELMQYLASRGNPEGLSLDLGELLRPPQMPWRYLAVPAGCRLAESTASGGRIACDAASFVWSVLPFVSPAEIERWREQTVVELQDTLPGASAVERVPCVLEGVETSCARVRVPGERGEQVTWVAAVGKWARGVLVMCSVLSGEASFPPACNEALTFP